MFSEGGRESSPQLETSHLALLDGEYIGMEHCCPNNPYKIYIYIFLPPVTIIVWPET